MKTPFAVFLAAAAGAWAQTAPGDITPERLSQLMESTAAAVPGLAQASAPLRQLVSGTVAAIHASPRDPSFQYRFVKEVGAYLALSGSFPRPQAIPETADRQFTELREGAQRMEGQFEALLAGLATAAQAHDADPCNLARYADADTKLPPPGVAARVVFLGDSITDFWRLNEYFTGRDFVNRGISGQTTLEMAGRFIADVVNLKPRAVLILAGTNDIARGIKAAQIEDNLAMLGELAKSNGIKPLFASIPPVSDYHKDTDPQYGRTKARPPALIRQINDWMKDFCAREGFTYVDYYSAMADASGQMAADMADDGLHPNAKGYRVMAPIALENLNRALAPTAPQASEKKRRFGALSK